MAAATPPRRPPRRPDDGRDHTPERILALAGVGGLLLVLIVSVAMIAGASGNGGDAAQAVSATTPEPTATATATATPKPEPTPVPLTAEERQERQAAADVVASRGFKVVRLRDYDPKDTLRVLIGKTSSGGHMAFFFVQGDYIGNDSSAVSASLRVKRTADLATTLTYGVRDAATGARSKVDVRFTWDGNRLSPDAALPDPSLRAPGG